MILQYSSPSCCDKSPSGNGGNFFLSGKTSLPLLVDNAAKVVTPVAQLMGGEEVRAGITSVLAAPVDITAPEF